jgi:hypothetical protein
LGAELSEKDELGAAPAPTEAPDPALPSSADADPNESAQSVARAAVSPESAQEPARAIPFRLAIPEGLVIDDLVRARLERQLARLPDTIDGVVAPVVELPPGVSCRTHAEWRSLEPLREVTTRLDGRAEGAVLLRGNVEFDAGEGVITVPGASLVEDAGAVVHDPNRPLSALATASELARPPFPRRLVVLLLGIEEDARVAEWSRKFANRAQRRDLEIRLALPSPVPGTYLTRPCAPAEQSVARIDPDIIVAMDAAALDRAAAWCSTNRSTVVVEFVANLNGSSGGIEIVPWQIGRAAGRLRARIGPRADLAALTALFSRLVAGPHVAPPTGVEIELTPRRAAERVVRVRPTTLVIAPTNVRAPSAAHGVRHRLRMDALADHLAVAGFKVAIATPDEQVHDGVRAASLVIVAGAETLVRSRGLLAERSDAARPIVLDLGPEDLADPAEPHRSLRLSDQALEVGRMCRLVTAPAGALEAAARSGLGTLGTRVVASPTLFTRGEIAALGRLATVRPAVPVPTVIGWRFGGGPIRRPPYLDGVVAAVTRMLSDGHDVTIEIDDEHDHLIGNLRRADRVRIGRAAAEGEHLTRWSFQIYTPFVAESLIVDDGRDAFEAGLAGTPSVMPLAARRAVEGHPSPQAVVHDVRNPDAWLEVIYGILTSPVRRKRRVEEARRHAATVVGPAASRAAANRLIGWAMYESDHR